MSLQLILGGSGSGKSHWLYTSLIQEAVDHPEKKFIVIVPEQFTMQTQRELASLHPAGGILNIDILSFQRLAFRVFEETGTPQKTVLTETGKNLLLRRVASEKAGELRILDSKLDRPGYISEMKSILSELTQYEITEEELGDMIDLSAGKPQLQYKLEDIRTLCHGFSDALQERFTTAEELLDLFCRAAENSRMLRESSLAFDGFTGFTPVQQNAMRTLLALCPRIQVALTLEEGESIGGAYQEHELFYLSKKTIRSLLDLARETGTEVLEPTVLRGGSGRFLPESGLCFLERHLFRYGKRVVYQNEGDCGISLHVCGNPMEEVRFAAREINRLIKEGGFRCREIAVIAGDLSVYGNYVRKVFAEYEIPHFVDQTVQVLMNPGLEFIRGALGLAEERFSYESVFRYLRTGFSGLEPEEIDRLENYVLALGIRGRARWQEEWTRETVLMAPGEAAVCEGYRRRVMERLQEYLAVFDRSRAPLKDYAGALYDLLSACEIQQQLKDQEVRFRSEGLMEKAHEYAQIYAVIIRLLDEAVELLGETEVGRREFADILEAGFSEARVGLIPPGIDEVHVGDMERTRLNHIRALFFLGLNDGWVPAKEKRGGIVSEMEREFLQEAGMELAPTARTRAYIQRFYLYLAMTKPSERLYLSWCQSGSDGAAMRPSYLVAMARRMFPGLKITDESKETAPERLITSLRTGLPWLAAGLRRLRENGAEADCRQVGELLWIYRQDPAYRSAAARLEEAAFLVFGDSRLKRKTARELYGEVLENSVTRLEQFASCAFAHFASYGLQLREREEYRVRPADIGTLFHRTLELYSRKLEDSPYNWFTVPDKTREELTEQSVREAAQDYGSQVFFDSERNRYALERALRIMKRSVWALQEQIRAGRFIPGNFEVSFQAAEDLGAVTIALGETETMRLRGRIDRVDLCEEEDKVYVKVIDYKSGNTSFDLAALYYGLQLQLVVYLNAAMEMEQRIHPDREIIPAGILYYRTQDPLVEGSHGQTPEEIRRAILKKLRPNGLVNSDPAVLDRLDAGLEKTSEVIPVGRKADGSLTAASSVADRAQFERLSAFVQEKLRELGQEILDGTIGAQPYRRGQEKACTYCVFAGVCGFDARLPGSSYRQVEELSKQEVWERI